MNAARTLLREFPRDASITHFTSLRSVLLGAGLCYAISEEKYHHTPLAFFVPSAYVGYQLYNNRDAIAMWTRAKLLS
jgi:hypothetical protein